MGFLPQTTAPESKSFNTRNKWEVIGIDRCHETEGSQCFSRAKWKQEALMLCILRCIWCSVECEKTYSIQKALHSSSINPLRERFLHKRHLFSLWSFIYFHIGSYGNLLLFLLHLLLFISILQTKENLYMENSKTS